MDNKRILIVAYPDSIHTTRWINQLKNQGFSVALFPSIDIGSAHPELELGQVYHSVYPQKHPNKSVVYKGLPVHSRIVASGFRFTARSLQPNYRAQQLAKLITRWKPDLVHSMELQHGAYLVNSARKLLKQPFPKWLVTNWGSDIYLFGRLKEHRGMIEEVLTHCDFYSCECQRDVELARQYGFKGETMPVFPNAGGVDLEKAQALRSPGKTSERTVIALKGYQNWSGRSLVGLRALTRCADLLKGYTIEMYSVNPGAGVEIAAELFSVQTGIPVTILPFHSEHEAALRLHGRARISLGLSISDGISTSFLEALYMGSFPIQSSTACADEWITCGKTGFIVPPEDPEEIEAKLRIALTEDKLVDTAAETNWKTAQKRLAQPVFQANILSLYQTILDN